MHTSILRTLALAGLLLICSSCGPQREEVWLDDIDPIPISEESSTSDPSLYSDEVLRFEDFFELEGETQISDEIVFGDRVNPVIGPAGQILMLDGELAGLFGPDGRLIAQVTPDACNPGYEWRPSRAQFLPQGGFLVFGYSRNGYWFDETGTCTGVFPHKPYSQALVLAADSTVFAAKLSNPEWQLVKYGPLPGEEEILISGKNTQLATRIIGGGLARSSDGDVFISTFHSPFLYRYREGQLEKLGYIPSYFRTIPSDLTEAEVDNSRDAMEKVRRAVTEFSTAGVIFQLDEDKLLLNFFNVDHPNPPADMRLPVAFHIMDTEGYPITKGALFQDNVRPVFARDGSIYTRVYDESGRDDAPLNPKIVEYRFASK